MISRWRRFIEKMIAKHPSFATLAQAKLSEFQRQKQETESGPVSSTSRKKLKIKIAPKESERLIQENNMLRKKLLHNQQLMQNLENEMGNKIAKQNEDFELVKQRENKLMFFLFVLKEEKRCPVTEVFDEYIKQIET